MRNTFWIAKQALKLIIKSKSSIFVYILSPILALSMALLVSNINSVSVTIGVCDLDQSKLSTDMIASLKQNENYHVVTVKKEAIDQKIADEKVSAVVVIPKGFEDQLIKGHVKNIDLISMKDSDITMWLQNHLQMTISSLSDLSKGANGNKDTFFSLYKGFSQQKLSYEKIPLKDEAKDMNASQSGIGFLLVFMLIGSSLAANSIIKDKTNRVYQRIALSPVRTNEYLLGHLLAHFCLTIVQVWIILFYAKLLHLNFHIKTYEMFLILLVFSLLSVSFGLFIAAVSRSSAQAGQITNAIITPSSMLGGCFWPIWLMPPVMQKLALIFPQAWVLKAVEEMQKGKTFGDVYLDLLVVFAYAILLFLISALRMKRNEELASFI